MDQAEWLTFLDGLSPREHWIVERVSEHFTSIASGFGSKFLEELTAIRAHQATDDKRLGDLEQDQQARERGIGD